MRFFSFKNRFFFLIFFLMNFLKPLICFQVFEGCVGLLDEAGGRPPPPDGGCAPPPLTSRMDGATLQHPILSLRGGPLGKGRRQ